VQAIREALECRPTPRNESYTDRVFLTVKGGSWVTADFLLSKETRKLLDSLGINGNRNFYAIRHTFETIAGDSRDQVAVNAVKRIIGRNGAETLDLFLHPPFPIGRRVRLLARVGGVERHQDDASSNAGNDAEAVIRLVRAVVGVDRANAAVHDRVQCDAQMVPLEL
jgi:hypothetical protein